MESVTTQRENLRQYREQLQAVDDGLRAGGASAEEREELEALRAELVDVIALTEELIAGCVDGEGASAGIAEASAGVAGAELAEAIHDVPPPADGKGKAPTSNLQSSVQEQIKRNQAKAALEGNGPASWAIGSRCEAVRTDGDGASSWEEAFVRAVNSAGNFVVEFKRDSKMREADVTGVRPHMGALREDRYVPVAAPVLHRAGDGSGAGGAGDRGGARYLKILPKDDEKTRQRKLKAQKSLKSKQRFERMDAAATEKRASWNSFIGKKKKGVKKQSIFATKDARVVKR